MVSLENQIENLWPKKEVEEENPYLDNDYL